MLSNLRAIVAGVVAIGLCAGVAQASDVEREMQQMQDMVLQMQDQLEEQQKRLDDQSDRMRSAGIAEEREASSGLSNFLKSTDFGGWIAVNYTYNTKGSGNQHLLDQNSTTFHPDSNSFKVDQLWFSMDKDVSAESRAGFHADIAFGSTANYGGYNTGNGNDAVTVYSAYLSYLIPFIETRLDFGEMWTMLGAEVVAAPDNFNITRGLVWGIQPVTYTGVMLSTEIGGVTMAFGAMNDVLSGASRDTDNNKAVTGSLGYSMDMFSVLASVIWGSQWDTNDAILNYSPCVDATGGAQFQPDLDTPSNDTNSNGDGICQDSTKSDLGIFDLTMTLDPTDYLSFWLDYTMQWQRPRTATNQDGYLHGIALAGRVGITDNFGVALRGEVLLDDRDALSGLDKTYSVTGTLDYALTDNLAMRGEVRWDKAQFSVPGSNSGSAFFRASDRNDSPSSDDQLLLLVEMIYTF